MRRFPALLAVLLAACPTPAAAGVVERNRFEHFGADAAIVVTQHGQTVDFDVDNDYPCPITVEAAWGMLDNVGPTPPPYPVVVPAGGRARLARMQVTDPKRRWNYRYDYHWTFGTPAARDDGSPYIRPFSRGANYKVLQGFNGPFSHKGLFAIDWEMAEGTPVLAARGGVVVAFNEKATSGGLSSRYQVPSASNWVLIQHADETLGAYYHLRHDGVPVAIGKRVGRGEVIGYSGNTGYSTEPHLHFEVRGPKDGETYRTFPVNITP